MRISDWSSDVCSSDLDWLARLRMLSGARFRTLEPTPPYAQSLPPPKVKALVPCMTALPPKLRMPPTTEFVMVNVRSEEHTSELQSLMRISYAVFCLKKKNNTRKQHKTNTITTRKR